MVGENWHALTVGDVERILKVNANEGLSVDEAKHRLDEFGPNELIEEAKITPFQILFGQFKSILVLVLLGAALISGFILEEVADMILIMIILIGNAILGFVQEYRAEKAVDALKKMIAPTARVRRGGKELLIPSKNVVPGETLVLEEGDRITADARVIKVVSLNTDEAPLTGESKPVAKRIEPLMEEIQMADRTNMVYMGTHVAYGRGEALAISTGMNTEFGKIAKLVQEVQEATPPLKQKMEQLGRQLVILSASLCVVCFTIGILAGRDLIFMFLVAVSMAVSAIPEGLPAVLTITLALGVNNRSETCIS
jgi:Ca2+-transporting ATPase